MEWTDLIKAAWGGPNAMVFAMLQAWLVIAQRVVRISTVWAFVAASLIGGALGSLRAFIDTQAVAGCAPAELYNNTLCGAVIGVGSVTLIGLGVSWALDKTNLAPISAAKTTAENIRDPLNPLLPAGARRAEPPPSDGKT